MASTSGRCRTVLDNRDYSPFITERRRTLFPVEDIDIDSELGHIIPLSSDGSDGESDSSNNHKVSDYDIVGIVQNLNGSETPRSTITYASSNMSPLTLSPYTGTHLNESPHNISPSHRLKTPHDTSSKSNSILKKEQKTLLEESKTSKRKASPSVSPIRQPFKYDSKNSRVRTALFPPESALDMSLPTQMFYPKNRENLVEKRGSFPEKHVQKPVRYPTTRYGFRANKKFGQINNGVKHKIRKPKQRKVWNKKVIAQTTKKLQLTSSALTEYIQDLSELKKFQQKDSKLISSASELQRSNIANKSGGEDKENTNVNINNSKLSQSPVRCTSPEDKTRRFFKSSRVKLKPNCEINASKKTVQDNNCIADLPPKSEDKIEFDTSDFQEEEVVSNTNIDNILCSLVDDSPIKVITPNRITLDVHTSISGSENSIQLHQNNVANMILSPISHMCDVTSGLALNSPKKARNLASILDSMPNQKDIQSNTSSGSSDMSETERYFPIFYRGVREQPGRGQKRERGEIKRTAKRFKDLGPDQMLLDAGQKKFGLTLCNECNIVYHMGDPGDEVAHINYHNSSQILRFVGWKNERIVADFHKNGRIIKVVSTDSKIWWKKVNDLMGVVKRDLGCYEMDYDISGSQVYLYINNHTIVGCAVATVPKEPGHKMLSTLNNIAMCSEETYPIKCGISHIWVHTSYRKQGIGTALLDSIKSNFMFGYILSNNDLALTSPTEAGTVFAEKYFKTPNFLIYYV